MFMKHGRFIFKTIWQVFLYAAEVLSVSIGLAYASQVVWPIVGGYEFVERVMTAYAVYEVFVFIILTNINDIEADSCLAYITYLRNILLYFESNNVLLEKEILANRERQLSLSTLNTPETYKSYEQSIHWIQERDSKRVQYELIRTEHHKEMVTLQWRFSFLLRRVK